MFITKAEKDQIKSRLTILERAFDNLMAQQQNKKKGKWTMDQRAKQGERAKAMWAKKRLEKEAQK